MGTLKRRERKTRHQSAGVEMVRTEKSGAVSHSMGAHTDSLQVAEHSHSENDEADAYNAAVSDATAAADNSPTDGDGGDDCEVCLVAPRDNSIALVPC